MTDRRLYQIYGPTHFRATWEKFLEICSREGQSASGLIRIWVENYVRLKDPENPQPPLTAYIEGQADHRALDVKKIMEELLRSVAMRGNEISRRMIVRSVEHISEPEYRMKAVERITQELQRRGVRVWL